MSGVTLKASHFLILIGVFLFSFNGAALDSSFGENYCLKTKRVTIMAPLYDHFYERYLDSNVQLILMNVRKYYYYDFPVKSILREPCTTLLMYSNALKRLIPINENNYRNFLDNDPFHYIESEIDDVLNVLSELEESKSYQENEEHVLLFENPIVTSHNYWNNIDQRLIFEKLKNIDSRENHSVIVVCHFGVSCILCALCKDWLPRQRFIQEFSDKLYMGANKVILDLIRNPS